MLPPSSAQFLASLITLVLFITICIVMLLVIYRPQVKIFEQTPERLKFQIRMPFWRAASLFFASFLIVPALLIIAATLTLPLVTTLSCDRHVSHPSGDASIFCNLVSVNRLKQKNTTSFSGLQKAIINNKFETHKDGKKDETYELFLILKDKAIPFNSLSYGIKDKSHYQELEENISKINSFVQNPLNNHLIVVSNESKMVNIGFTFSIFLIFLSIPIFTIVPLGTYIFDREKNQVIINNYQWFRSQVIEHSLNDIVDIQVDAGDGEEGGKVYRFKLILQSGEILPLNACYMTFSSPEIETITHNVKTFLNSDNSHSEELDV